MAFLAELGRLQTDQDALAGAAEATREALLPQFRFRVGEFCASVDAYFHRICLDARSCGLAVSRILGPGRPEDVQAANGQCTRFACAPSRSPPLGRWLTTNVRWYLSCPSFPVRGILSDRV